MTPAQLFWTIDQIAAATHGQLHSDAAATSITGISINSRDTMPGDLFVALPGTASDGHKFLPAAMAAGASAALVTHLEPPRVAGFNILRIGTLSQVSSVGIAGRAATLPSGALAINGAALSRDLDPLAESL